MSMIGMFAQLTNEQFSRVLSNPESLEEILESLDEDSVLDVDKAWEGIYYVLTGTALAEEVPHPLGKVLFSGQHFDESMDLGYGPAHYLNPEQVKELNTELHKITDEDLKARFDGEKMDEKGVYPEGWSEEEAFGYLLENFQDLKDFYQSAADGNNAMVMYIS